MNKNIDKQLKQAIFKTARELCKTLVLCDEDETLINFRDDLSILISNYTEWTRRLIEERNYKNF